MIIHMLRFKKERGRKRARDQCPQFHYWDQSLILTSFTRIGI